MTADRGFTLLEMLVTLAVVGVVLALLMSVIGFGGSVQRTVINTERGISDRVLWQRLLNDTFSQLDASRGFQGDERRLSVVAEAPPGLGIVGPVETTFAQEPDQGITINWVVNGRGVISKAISSKGARMTLSYFATGVGWSNRWIERLPPDLVKLTFENTSEDRSEFIITVKTVQPSKCLRTSLNACGAGP